MAVSLPALLLDAAESEPDRTVLHQVSGPSLTYKDLAERASAWAAILTSLGVGRGEAVATMLPNGAMGQLGWLGTAWIGAVDIPINHGYPGGWVERLVREAGARVAVIAAEFSALWEPLVSAGALDHLVIVSGTDDAVHLTAGSGRDALGMDRSVSSPVCADRYDVSCVIYTSGTTGASKGVVVPWGQWEARSVSSNIPSRFRTRDYVFYCPLPVFHTAGRVYFYDAVQYRSTLVTRERFKTSAWLDDIRKYGCTGTVLMGAAASFVHNTPVRDDDHETALQHVLMAPIPTWVDEFSRRFGVEVTTSFSASEYAYPIVSGDRFEVSSESGASCGVADPAYEVRLVTPEGDEAGTDEPGELLVRAEPWVNSLGYWRRPDASAEAWRGGWFHTGDILKRDEQGRFYFVDRVKDMIRRRAENISSLEVEACASEHPAVAHAAAFGVPSDHGEEEVMLIVVTHPGVETSEDDIHRHLSNGLPYFAVPRFIEFMTELPTNDLAKVLKRDLRQRGVTAATVEFPDSRMVSAGPDIDR